MEINSLNGRLEDEQSLVQQLQKRIKEQQVRLPLPHSSPQHVCVVVCCDVRMYVCDRRALKNLRRSWKPNDNLAPRLKSNAQPCKKNWATWKTDSTKQEAPLKHRCAHVPSFLIPQVYYDVTDVCRLR